MWQVRVTYKGGGWLPLTHRKKREWSRRSTAERLAAVVQGRIHRGEFRGDALKAEAIEAPAIIPPPFPELEAWGPKNLRKARRGCEHTEDYLDERAGIVCVAGWMIDIDTFTEGFQRQDFKRPCSCCNKELFVQWMASEMWQQEVPDDEISQWIADQNGVPVDRCKVTPDIFGQSDATTSP